MARSGAEELIRILADEGVDHLFFNPGTDTAPIQEALALARERCLPHPRTVLCTHELVALSAALGNHFVTGRAQALAVHVDAGTLNLGAALHNVQRNHTPVVVLAGRSPYSVDARVPGHRDSPIHWQQEQPDQGAAMRAYGKWTMEVPRGRELGPLLRRAFQVARAAPSGPTYLMLPRETLMEPAEAEARPLTIPHRPAPDPEGLRELARKLCAAERPVIIAQRAGRHAATVDTLVRIAELLGAIVLEQRDAVNFPAAHPLYGGPATAEALRRADVLLLLESEVPWVPAAGGPTPGASLLQIDVDCVKATMPSWTYPVDLALTADTAIALPLLEARLEELGDAGRRAAWADHRRDAEEAAAALRSSWQSRARSDAVADAPDAMLAALDRALPDGAITIQEAVTNSAACQRQLCRPAGRHFDVGAPALGGALGAALGATLGEPGAPVVAIVGDGAFNFGIPTAALWSAHRAGAPFVTVILNNGSYLASREPVRRLFPGGASERQEEFPETVLGGSLDYPALARACGGEGEVVHQPEEMEKAMRRALALRSEGRCAVIDARLPLPR